MKLGIKHLDKGNGTHAIAIAIKADQKIVGQARRIELVDHDQMSDIEFEVEGVKVQARVVVKIYAKPGQILSRKIMNRMAHRKLKEGLAILTQ